MIIGPPPKFHGTRDILLIIDHELYQAQTQNRAKECGITTDTLLASNHFPAYRGGTPVSEEPQPVDSTPAKRAPGITATSIITADSILPIESAVRDRDMQGAHKLLKSSLASR